jgi:3-oxoacyl-[acyl-carrier protein] reductase
MGSAELIGKTALVTGSSRGIGKAIALALAKAGADVAVNYMAHEQEAQEVCGTIKGLGRRSTAVRADVSSASDVTRLVETVRRELGAVTILVNNAGIARTRTPDDITEQDWDVLVNLNLRAPFLVTQAVVAGMRTARWGRIINISSTAAQLGGVVGPHYAASKAGLIGLTHYYASQLAKEGITANTIVPGPVPSDMSANLPQLNVSMVPIGRFGEPEEVAVAVVAVLLAGNGLITGQTINVNGGRYMS